MLSHVLPHLLAQCHFLCMPMENKIFLLCSEIQQISSNDSALTYPLFYTNDFLLKNKSPFLAGNYFFEYDIPDFLSSLSLLPCEKPEIIWEELEKDLYTEQFLTLKHEIGQGVLQKGVPYSHQTGVFQIEWKHKIYLLKQLFLNAPHSSYIYGSWDQCGGCIGASPELLFKQQGQTIQTTALAGTLPRFEVTTPRIILEDQKIRTEHNLVIQGMQKSLSPIGPIEIGETQAVFLKSLVHLKTDITLQLQEKLKFEDILKNIHPTPALGVFPKENTSAWLENTENEKQSRGIYASPFGLLLDANRSVCIARIRGIQWSNSRVWITAGGGVTRESSLTKEWDEIQHKILAIKAALGIG